MEHSIGKYKIQCETVANNLVDINLAFQDQDIARAEVKYITDTTGKRCIAIENAWISRTAPLVHQVGMLESGKKLAALVVQYAVSKRIKDIVVPKDIKELFLGYTAANSPVHIH